MASNPPLGKGRVGPVKKRIQAVNARSKRFVKINTDTHLFIDQAAKKYAPFKGVRKHK